MTYTELIAEQDRQRTARNFISMVGGIAGVDQSYSDDDYRAQNLPGTYQTIGSGTYGGGVAVEGQSVSTLQGGKLVISFPFLLLCGLGFLLLKKG